MAGWRSSGECLGGLGILRGLRLGQAIFFFTRKKENKLPRCLVSWGGSWGVLTILGGGSGPGILQGWGSAILRATPRRCAQWCAKGGSAILSAILGRQFLGNSPS